MQQVQLKNLLNRHWFGVAIVLYVIIFKLIKWISLSIISFVYFFLFEQMEVPTHPLQSIGQSYDTFIFFLNGVTAFCFVLIIQTLRPLLFAGIIPNFLNWMRPRKSFFSGLFRGFLFTTFYMATLIYFNVYTWKGIFQTPDNLVGLLSAFLIKGSAIVLFVLVEEVLFRKILLEFLVKNYNKWVGIFLSSLCYLIFKSLEYTMDYNQLITLFLCSFSLGYLSYLYRDHLFGAGFFSTLLITFHLIFGLPLFGLKQVGLITLQYSQTMVQNTSFHNSVLHITGGYSGPFASILTQSVFLLFILILFFYDSKRSNKIAFNPSSKSLK